MKVAGGSLTFMFNKSVDVPNVDVDGSARFVFIGWVCLLRKLSCVLNEVLVYYWIYFVIVYIGIGLSGSGFDKNGW